MSAHGTYERIEGRFALRYVRHLPHPIDKVWAAVTQPAELASWFPCRVEVVLRVGGPMRFVFPDHHTEVSEASEGEVLALDPPRRFWFSWDAEEMRIDLEPTPDGGCALTFSDLMPDDYNEGAARTAAGWHVCLDMLAVLLDRGQAVAPTDEPTDHWRELYDAYVALGFPHGAPMPGGQAS